MIVATSVTIGILLSFVILLSYSYKLTITRMVKDLRARYGNEVNDIISKHFGNTV